MSITCIQTLNDEEFRRLTGVKRKTFNTMLQILEHAHKLKKALGGRPNKLSMTQCLLLTLEYLREYRTYFHIGMSYGVSESTAFKIVAWVEETLVKDSTFALPGKKVLAQKEPVYSKVLMDASETAIERPKKNKKDTTPERESVIL